MSLQSWKAEFYPVPASEVAAEDAVAHSLRKWIGLRRENLERHGVEQFENRLRGDSKGTFIIDASSCALCVHYFHAKRTSPCVTCPLFEVLGVSCDSDDGDDPSREGYAPYFAGTDRNDPDPEPMIAALEKALAVTT